MSAVLDKSCATSIVPFRQFSAQNQEGNWNEYLYQSARCRNADYLPQHPVGLLAWQRDCALAYLGKRAQLRGGACSKTKPRILTPEMIADLEASNRAKRHSQYPWMEALMHLLTESERTQDQFSNSTKVISLVPANASSHCATRDLVS